MKAGAFDYLAKPVELEHLLGKIAQAYDLIVSHREQKMAEEYKARVEQRMIATEKTCGPWDACGGGGPRDQQSPGYHQ